MSLSKICEFVCVAPYPPKRSNSMTIRPVPVSCHVVCPIWTPYAGTLTLIQERPILAHDRTASAGAICYAVCPIQAHTHHAMVEDMI